QQLERRSVTRPNRGNQLQACNVRRQQTGLLYGYRQQVPRCRWKGARRRYGRRSSSDSEGLSDLGRRHYRSGKRADEVETSWLRLRLNRCSVCWERKISEDPMTTKPKRCLR